MLVLNNGGKGKKAIFPEGLAGKDFSKSVIIQKPAEMHKTPSCSMQLPTKNQDHYLCTQPV
jgi:hypothetical protein